MDAGDYISDVGPAPCNGLWKWIVQIEGINKYQRIYLLPRELQVLNCWPTPILFIYAEHHVIDVSRKGDNIIYFAGNTILPRLSNTRFSIKLINMLSCYDSGLNMFLADI